MTAIALIAGQKLERSRTGSSPVGLVAGTASSGTPPREHWLYEPRNKAALKMVRDGIEDAKQGRIKAIGSLAQHADDVID